MAKSKLLSECVEGEWVYFNDAQLVQVRLCKCLTDKDDKLKYKFILSDVDNAAWCKRDNYKTKVFPLSIYTKNCAFRIKLEEEYIRKKEVWSYPHKPADNKYGDWAQYLAEQFYKLASLNAKDPLMHNHAGYLILKEISDMVDKTAEFYKNNPEVLAEGNFLLGLVTALEEKGPEVAVSQLKSSKYKNT